VWNIPIPFLFRGNCTLAPKSRVRRAAKDAQKTARMYGTPLYVWENGKVVAKKP
jgi:hypothetical protein